MLFSEGAAVNGVVDCPSGSECRRTPSFGAASATRPWKERLRLEVRSGCSPGRPSACGCCWGGAACAAPWPLVTPGLGLPDSTIQRMGFVTHQVAIGHILD